MIDPDWAESDFERLWAFVERHKLSRAGFTILTPLPGTAYYEQTRVRASARCDGRSSTCTICSGSRASASQRFFELYCETWRRSVLNIKGEKKLWHWLAHAKPRHWMHLLQVLSANAAMMQPAHYIRDHALL